MPFKLRIIIALCCAGVSGGCAIQQARSSAETQFEGGVSVVNSLIVRGYPEIRQVVSYAQIAGEIENRVDNEVHPVETLSAEWGELEVVTPDIEFQQMLDALEVEQDQYDLILSAVKSTIGEAIASMREVRSRSVRIRVLAAPLGSGYSIQETQPVTEKRLALSIALGVGTEERLQQPAVFWWAQMSSTVAHELLHLHYRLAQKEFDLVDEETAAHLVGNCSFIRMALHMGSGDATFETRLSEADPRVLRALPGILEGRFEPRVEHLQYMSTDSNRARILALALFHVHSEEGVLAIGDPDKVAPILEFCDRLSQSVPRFSLGETE